MLVFFSRSATNNGTGVGIFSLITLGFRVYWAYRYHQLAKQLQQVNLNAQPSRTEIIQFLRIGLLASLVGLLLAFIASKISSVALVADAIARSQAVTVYERENVIRSADLFLILAQLNILGAHFFGSANCLGLLSWISKEEVMKLTRKKRCDPALCGAVSFRTPIGARERAPRQNSQI